MCAFRSPIIYKCLHIPFQALYSLPHLRVELLGFPQTSIEVEEGLRDASISRHDRVPLPRNTLVSRPIRLHASVLQEFAVGRRELLEERALLVACLKETRLVGPEFLKLDLEELTFVIRDRLLVEDEYVGNVIDVNLQACQELHDPLNSPKANTRRSYLLFQVLEYLGPLPLDQLELLEDFLDPHNLCQHRLSTLLKVLLK